MNSRRDNCKSVLGGTVLEGGYCIGCGACSVVAGGGMNMRLSAFGMYEAVGEAATGSLGEVCPFSDQSANEDTISSELYPELPLKKGIGNYSNCYAGHVATPDFRARGSSGGLGKWVLVQLLEQGIVDYVIQVTAVDPGDGRLVYKYVMSDSIDEVRAGSKSAYHPVEMSEVLGLIRDRDARYAITGVPCFIKAVRLLQRVDPLFKDRIRFTIGIFCGHLKSAAYGEMLGWQLGIDPGELQSIDFREKLSHLPANHKGVRAVGRERNSAPEVKSIRELYGGNYNIGFFQYKACDFCDDVVAETADISIGDAWLPEYIKDPAGTSMVVVRNRELAELLVSGMKSGELELEEVAPEKVVQSQAGGFRQRGEGLAYRLHLTDEKGEWRPKKRVEASQNHIGKARREVYELRSRISAMSHDAFRRAREGRDWSGFVATMKPELDRLTRLSAPHPLVRIKNGLLRRLRTLISK